jgi:aryl-alcohol dehydrogenase-like predicted oxidoreductase
MGMDGLGWLKDRNLTPERLDKVHALHQMAMEIEVSLPRLAVAWCLRNPHVSTVILGASRVDQLEETLTSLEVLTLLSDEVVQKIEDILGNKPVLPEY